MADDLSTLFINPLQPPWTDRNSPLYGGSGRTPLDLNLASTDTTPGQTSVAATPLIGPRGGQTPPDSEAAGRTPRVVSRIPDQPPYQHGNIIPIPTQNTGSAHFTPVGSSSMGNDDLDAVTRTILSEVGEKASPSEMASIAATIRNRQAVGGYGSSPSEIVHAPKQFTPWSNPNAANYPMKYDASSPAYQQAQATGPGFGWICLS